MKNKCGMHFYVTGLVQGVWFRSSTQSEARKLGLTGWARNLPDGGVEVLAFGEKESLVQLHAWLKVGPPRAKVTDVACEEVPWQEVRQFEVG